MADAASPRQRASAADGRRLSAASLLLTVLLGAVLYAAFADGATGLPEESWFQLGLLVIAAFAAGAWLYGGALRPSASAPAWVGVGLLAAFVVWTGVTILWSVAPDRSWIELNRSLSYLLALVLGIAVGSSLPRALQRTATGMALLVVPVAVYALIGKTLPALADHAGPVTRLRAPLEYWNALALFSVFGLFVALRMAADPARRLRSRLPALGLVYALMVVLGLTYSRGGFLALLVGLAVLVASTTERVRTLALFAGAAAMSILPLGFALLSPDLTRNALPLAQRRDDALLVLIVFAVGLAVVLGWGRLMVFGERRLDGGFGRRWGRRAALAAALLFGIGFVNAVANGAVSAAVDSFTDTQGASGVTDPTRLLSTNSGNRWTWWNEAAGAWWDEPLAGWGAGSFPVTHLMYRTEPLPVRQPHSVPLQWLAETGLVGLILAGGALIALIAAAVRRVRSLPWAVSGAPQPRGYGAALLAIPVAWAAHSFYDWDWDIPAVTAPMFIVLGVLVARPTPQRREPLPLRGTAYATGIALLVVAALSAALPALAEVRTNASLGAVGAPGLSDRQLAEAAADAEVAADVNPLAVEPLVALASIAERRGRIEEARRQLLRALDRQPSNVSVWARLARVEFLRLDRAGVRAASQRALELDPLNPALFALARRAQQAAAAPAESATATGTPLPRQVPVTDPGLAVAAPPTIPLPAATPVPTP